MITGKKWLQEVSLNNGQISVPCLKAILPYRTMVMMFGTGIL
jgi:hypothetical protein